MVLLSFCLIFCPFQPGFAYKSVAYKKSFWCYDNSISNPQLENGFTRSWKLSLNFGSHKWLRTSISLVINSISLVLWLLKTLLSDGLLNLRILFLKTFRLLEFLKFRSRLFHCIIPDRKNIFLKRFCLVWSCFEERHILRTSSRVFIAS